MHQPIGISAGIVSIGRMPGRVVEQFEDGTSLINIKSVENVQRNRCQTVYLCRHRNNYDCTLNIKQRNGW